MFDEDKNWWVKFSDKYTTKMVEEVNLEKNKGKSLPTIAQFHEGLQYKPMPVDKAGVLICVNILPHMAGERTDIQCATPALASKVTCPDEDNWGEMKQGVYPNKPEEEEASACCGPSTLQVLSNAD